MEREERELGKAQLIDSANKDIEAHTHLELQLKAVVWLGLTEVERHSGRLGISRTSVGDNSSFDNKTRLAIIGSEQIRVRRTTRQQWFR